MTPPDYRDWLTKAEAAEAIGVSTKTIEAWAQAKKLQQASRPQAHGPALAVFHPEDVARLAAERRTGPLPPFVVPVPDSARGNGSALSQVRETGPAGAELLREFLGALVQAIATTAQNSEKPTSESSEKLYVSVREAAAITGLPMAEIRRAVAAGTVTARCGRVRRKDLEQL
jgi:pyruvate/2-oxoglutarate dehydrogenase complex dihydrolipoamide acyltransferase (E2) component